MVQTTTQTTAPWIGQQGPLQSIYRYGEALMGTPQSYFPGQTVAGFAPAQEIALGLTQQRALGGNPAQNALGGYLAGQLQQPGVGVAPAVEASGQLAGAAGAGLTGLQGLAGGGPNPYLDQMFQAGTRALNRNFQESVVPSLNATFGGAGRTGGGLHQQSLTDAGQRHQETVGDFAANLYGGQYQADQNRRLAASQGLIGAAGTGIGGLANLYGQQTAAQQGAAGLVPSLSNLEYQDLDRLFGAGAQQRGLAQQQIQDQVNRFNFYQQQPWQNLERFAGLVQARPWGGTTTTQVPGPSPWQYLAGAGLLAGGLAGQFAGGGAGG